MLDELKRNGSGYYDPTAYKAMRNYEREEGKMEVYRGDIFFVTGSGGKVTGSEIKQDRPAVVVSNDMANRYSPVVEVVFLTSIDKAKHLPTHAEVICQIPSTALCEQVNSVSKSRLATFIRSCTDKEMKAIDHALMVSLGLDETKSKGNSDGAVKALNEEINDLLMMLKCSEKNSEERRLLLEDSQKQLSDAIEHIEELNAVLEELEKAKLVNENALKRTVEILKEENDELKRTSSPAEVIALKTERDLYKQQYEMMLERLIGA